MMEDLQQAYAAYQQALYHLRDPKVRFHLIPISALAKVLMAGTETLVWYRYSLRSLRIS